MNAKLKIKLLSNTCIALGSSRDETSDMDVYQDKRGNPYIPSKRIKGLIRGTIEEFNYLTNNSIDINSLLGKPCEDENSISKGIGGSLFIEDAILNSEADISIKTQTAIDENTHEAKKGSLRTIRVINKGAIFESNVTLDSKDFDSLSKAVTLLRHIGLNRNRGLGLVKVSLIKDCDEVKRLDNNLITTKLLKIKIENISNLMISSINQNETIDYIPASTILGYFANKYFKLSKNQSKMNELFLNEGHLIFSNAYISDEKFNEYIPCPIFIKKYKNLSVEGRVEYVNKFFKEDSSNKIEKKIASLDNKYIRVNTFENKIDINNLRLIEPEYEYAYHNSLDKYGKVKDFYQYFSLKKNQYFVSYIYGDSSKLKELFNIVNEEIVYFGKSRNSQYGKCKISIESVSEKENKGNVLIFKSPVTLSIDNKELLEANDIAKHIKSNLKVENYSLKYTNLGGFNMLWGLPKIARTAIDGGSYIELNNCDTSDIVKFLDKCKVSKLDYMIVDKLNLENIEKTYESNPVKEVVEKSSDEIKIKAKALQKYKETKANININQTQLERLLLLIKETKSLKEFNEEIGLIAKDNIKKRIKELIEKVKNEYNESNYKLYLSTYLNLLKWEGRKNESNKK